MEEIVKISQQLFLYLEKLVTGIRAVFHRNHFILEF